MIYNNNNIDIDIDIDIDMMIMVMMMIRMSYYKATKLQSYKAAGLRYMVNRSTKTVINVDVASLVVAS